MVFAVAMLRIMSTRIERAEADLVRLNRRTQQLAEQLAELRAEKQKIESYIEMERRYGAMVEAGHDTEEDVSKSEMIVLAAVSAIEQAGRPMSIGELADIIEAQGLTIGGGEKRNAHLASYLSRADEVNYDKVRRGWIVGEIEEGPAEAEPSEVVGPDAGARGGFSQASPEGSIPSGSTSSFRSELMSAGSGVQLPFNHSTTRA